MRSSRDERGSMILTLMLIMVFSILAVTIMTASIAQLRVSTNTTTRNKDLQGALAGVQAAVSSIRAANANGYVVPSQLPCSTVSGVTNTSGSETYTASIQYYDQTPQGSYVSVTCTPGQGPAAPATGNFLSRAVVTSCSPSTACTQPTSSPTANTIWRRVVSTYNFNTSNANIPGGLIYSYSGQECLLAQYANGVDTTQGLNLEITSSCSASNPLEQFQYTPNWNLDIQVGGVDYCVQDPNSSTQPVKFGSCTSTAVAQWGVDDLGGLHGVASGGTPTGQPNSWCLTNPLASDQGGTLAASVGSCPSSFNNTSTWQMSSRVGAGGSQPPNGQAFGVTNQLVNFQEFGSCFDVTNEDVTSSFLIDYMCKQFPDTTDYPAWNQRVCFNQISTDANNNPVGVLYVPQGQTVCSGATSPYCVVSPLQPASSNTYAWVTVTSCSPSSHTQPSNLLWTEWAGNGGAIHDYTWTDNSGYCLEANTANPQKPSGNSDAFSPIQVDTCNGSYEQKWNAPPSLGVSQITNTHEGTGTGTYTGP